MTYVKKQRLADGIFVVFTVCWVVSRIGLLPYRILYYSLHLALERVPMFSAYYIFNGLLCALQALHIVWTWFIVRIAIHAVKNNGVFIAQSVLLFDGLVFLSIDLLVFLQKSVSNTDLIFWHIISRKAFIFITFSHFFMVSLFSRFRSKTCDRMTSRVQSR